MVINHVSVRPGSPSSKYVEINRYNFLKKKHPQTIPRVSDFDIPGFLFSAYLEDGSSQDGDVT